MSKRSKTIGLVLLAGAIALSVWLGVCWPAGANMPGPMRVEGGSVGEPAVLTQAEVRHEALRFDLAPIANQQPGNVAVTYTIHNPEAATTADFLFISPGILDGRVTINGQPVPVQALRRDAVPAKFAPAMQRYQSQQPPDHPSTASKDVYLTFRASLPTGEVPIEVRYRVQPGITGGFSVYKTYDIRYNLSPIRDWKKLDQLDIAIALPAGWVATPNVPFQTKEPDQLTASFQSIPADELVIELQPGNGDQVTQAYNRALIGGLLLSAVACGGGGWFLGRFSQRLNRWVAKRGWHRGWVDGLGKAALALALVPLCPLLVWPLLNLADAVGRWGLPMAHVSSLWNGVSGRIWAALLFGLVGVLLAWVGFAIALMRRRPNPLHADS
jgi:hypothetical protein